MNLHCAHQNCININNETSSHSNLHITPCPHCKKVFYCSDSCRATDWSDYY